MIPQTEQLKIAFGKTLKTLMDVNYPVDTYT